MTNTASSRRAHLTRSLREPCTKATNSGGLHEEVSVGHGEDEQVLFESLGFEYDGDEEDERHHLIEGHDQNLSHLGEQTSDRIGSEVFTHNEHQEPTGLFGSVASYFTPFNATYRSQVMHLRTDDHTYAASYGASHNEAHDRLPTPLRNFSKKTRSQRTRPALLILLFLVLILCFSLLLLKLLSLVQMDKSNLIQTARPFESDVAQLDETHQKQLELEKMSRWLVSTPKCHIPVLDPWDVSIKDYVKEQEPMDCAEVIASSFADVEHRHLYTKTAVNTLSFVRNNRLYFSSRALAMGALVGRCCLKPITRSLDNDDDLDYSDTCTPIRHDGLQVNHSLVEIICTKPLNYINVHQFVKHNEEEEAALARVAKVKMNPVEHYNVLMVGVDTVSRLNAQRQLKRTLTILQERYKTLSFAGYNKVGENTFPNLVPLLTGLKPEQLVEVQCWEAKNYTQESDAADGLLDNCKYLWNYYQQIGYATYFSEDWPSVSTFNYLKPGFKSEPTTHYGRPFTIARENLTFPRFESTGCSVCQLDRPIVQVDLENLQAFIQYHRDRPYFAFHWINCPQHDDLNGGSLIDPLLENFFAQIHNITHLENTFVVFFSDHGYRWNDFASTRIGHYESSLPLLTVAPPKSFIERQPELYARLKEHQNALLTPFDLFKTLIDLKNLSSARSYSTPTSTKRTVRKAMGDLLIASPLEDIAISPSDPMRDAINVVAISSPTPVASVKEVKLKDGTTYRQKFKTLSLFDKNTPEELDRSCIEAGIPDNYCVCHQFQPIKVDKTEVLGAAYFLVYIHMEARLHNHYQLCHYLDLERVHHAEVFKFDNLTARVGKRDSSGRRPRRQVVPLINMGPVVPILDPSQVMFVGQSQMMPLVQQASLVPAIEDSRQSEVSNFDTTSPARQNLTLDKSSLLPDREYSIVLSTKPGGGLFQEVVRFYGTDMKECEREILKARNVVDDPGSEHKEKLAAAKVMQSVCDFSVNSDSLSRFNFYKDQSKCVSSDIELKKLCYCNDLN